MSGVLVLGIIFFIVSIYLIYIRRYLLVKSWINGSGKLALVISVLALFYLVYRWGEEVYDYITVATGSLMSYLTVISGGITAQGLKSSSRLRSTSQIWSGITRVEITRGKLVKLSYVGNAEANVLYFKEEDYSRLADILNQNLNENTNIVIS